MLVVQLLRGSALVREDQRVLARPERRTAVDHVGPQRLDRALDLQAHERRVAGPVHELRVRHERLQALLGHDDGPERLHGHDGDREERRLRLAPDHAVDPLPCRSALERRGGDHKLRGPGVAAEPREAALREDLALDLLPERQHLRSVADRHQRDLVQGHEGPSLGPNVNEGTLFGDVHHKAGDHVVDLGQLPVRELAAVRLDGEVLVREAGNLLLVGDPLPVDPVLDLLGAGDVGRDELLHEGGVLDRHRLEQPHLLVELLLPQDGPALVGRQLVAALVHVGEEVAGPLPGELVDLLVEALRAHGHERLEGRAALLQEGGLLLLGHGRLRGSARDDVHLVPEDALG
mmetsp:Transcript_29714/g.80338  ORF Transcript_29714/g.80338 Transcript_29714/m.80338 type:complete len:347 (+) Transcript_29714:539-1579(+)